MLQSSVRSSSGVRGNRSSQLCFVRVPQGSRSPSSGPGTPLSWSGGCLLRAAAPTGGCANAAAARQHPPLRRQRAPTGMLSATRLRNLRLPGLGRLLPVGRHSHVPRFARSTSSGAAASDVNAAVPVGQGEEDEGVPGVPDLPSVDYAFEDRNSVTFIGFLDARPSKVVGRNKQRHVRMNLAVSQGPKTTKPAWYRVSCRGQVAESAAAHLTKGSMVRVKGILKLMYTTDRSGTTPTSVRPLILAEDIARVRRPSTAGKAAQRAPKEQAVQREAGSKAPEDDELSASDTEPPQEPAAAAVAAEHSDSDRDSAVDDDDGRQATHEEEEEPEWTKVLGALPSKSSAARPLQGDAASRARSTSNGTLGSTAEPIRGLVEVPPDAERAPDASDAFEEEGGAGAAGGVATGASTASELEHDKSEGTATRGTGNADAEAVGGEGPAKDDALQAGSQAGEGAASERDGSELAGAAETRLPGGFSAKPVWAALQPGTALGAGAPAADDEGDGNSGGSTRAPETPAVRPSAGDIDAADTGARTTSAAAAAETEAPVGSSTKGPASVRAERDSAWDSEVAGEVAEDDDTVREFWAQYKAQPHRFIPSPDGKMVVRETDFLALPVSTAPVQVQQKIEAQHSVA